MIFWVVAIVVTAATLYAVARPFLWPDTAGDGDAPLNAAAYDVAVFRSQLQEVERDLARGRITPEEAEASRVEVGRRLLAADRRLSAAGGNATPSADPVAPGHAAPNSVSRGIAGVIVCLAVGVAVLIYARMGDPRNPDMPLVLRAAERELAQSGGGAGSRTPASETAEAGTLDDMAIRLRTRLEAGEGGPEDWSLLGRTEMMRGNYDAAAAAYGEALKAFPDDPDLNSAYGEALVFWGNGTVSDQAYTVFQRVLRAAPNDVRARFYSADYDRQEGRYRIALDAWIDLIRAASPDAPWLEVVQERARMLAAQMGVDLSEALGPATDLNAPPGLGTLSDAIAGTRGPGPDDIDAARDMSPEDRQAMIQAMVDGLAARLEADPADFEGWMRLIRSRAVLGDMPGAQTALDTAFAQFSTAPFPMRELAALADELGLESVDVPRGPSQQDIEAAEAMTPDERQDMIAGMVGTLAARLRDNPDDLQGWVMLGRSYMVLNRPAEAIQALERASELAPRNAELLIDRARLLRAQAGDRQTPETVALMHQVAALDPNNIEALWFLGLDAFRSEDRGAARGYFDRALAALPDGSDDHKALLEEVRRLFPDGN